VRFRRIRAGERVARKRDGAPADWSLDDVVSVVRHPSRTMGGGSGSPGRRVPRAVGAVDERDPTLLSGLLRAGRRNGAPVALQDGAASTGVTVLVEVAPWEESAAAGSASPRPGGLSWWR